MKEFASHIDYLIQKHDCVIIPDFGGFVLNREAAQIADDGSITPPKVSVGFNPDLTYNDGLLAESYMNVYSISYDTACKRIADVVKKLNTTLALRKPIQVGLLGKLSQEADGRLTFDPNTNLSASHTETFGLSILNIKRLADVRQIEQMTIVDKKRTAYGKVVASICATAAAVLVFFVTSTPILENETANTTQKSGFFTDIVSTSTTRTEKAVLDAPALSSNAVAADPVSTVEVEKPNAEPEAKKTVPAVVEKTITPVQVNQVAVTPKFFIIVGSAGSKSEAQRTLTSIRNKGYKDANMMTSPDRTRVYVASFSDRTQAEKYLVAFRKNNPELSDAWMFIKRN